MGLRLERSFGEFWAFRRRLRDIKISLLFLNNFDLKSNIDLCGDMEVNLVELQSLILGLQNAG